MGFPKLEIGDLVVTRTYTGKESVEICQYRGATGSLLYMLYHPEAILKTNLERFVKDTDSVPYSVSIIRKSSKQEYAEIIANIPKKE